MTPKKQAFLDEYRKLIDKYQLHIEVDNGMVFICEFYGLHDVQEAIDDLVEREDEDERETETIR